MVRKYVCHLPAFVVGHCITGASFQPIVFGDF